MPEWPDDLLAGLDGPRPLPDTMRTRLADALLSTAEESSAARPLGDALSARLTDELSDPVAAALTGADGPRALPAAAAERLTGALVRPRHRPRVALGAIAAAVVVLGGVALGIGLSAGGPGGVHARASGTAGRSRTPTATVQRGSEGAASGAGAGSSAVPGPGGAQTMSPALPDAAAAPAGTGPIVTALSPASGPTGGGTWVTISGVGLSGVRSVQFGTTAALAVVAVSDSEVRAEAPPHPVGVVDVTVVGPSGPSPSGTADHFTYTS